MTSSKYLPPFTNEQRAAVAGGGDAAHASAGSSTPANEVTYADFLGDEVAD